MVCCDRWKLVGKSRSRDAAYDILKHKVENHPVKRTNNSLEILEKADLITAELYFNSYIF